MDTIYDGTPGISSQPANKKQKGQPVDEDAPVGQVVALVASDSTSTEPKIFLAKLLNVKDGLAQLHHLEKISSSDNLYRPAVGRGAVWYEQFETLIWPIFITFDEDSRGYRLHNTVAEIVKHGEK